MGGILTWIESHVFLGSLIFFTLLYAFGYFVLFNNWKGSQRFEAASCCNSLVHGVVVFTLSCYDIASSPWKLDAANTELEIRTMDFSLAYFAIDMIYYLLINPSDYLFISHHVATTSYMTSCRCYTGHGGLAVAALIATGEATSPFQNVWTLARMARGASPLASGVYAALSPIFTVYFTIMRCIVGPYLAWKLGCFYFPGKADRVIPRGVAYFWMTCVILAIVGSSIWVYKLWTGLIRFYARRRSASPQPKIHKAE